MKFRLLIAGLLSLLMTLNAWSGTLKLSPEIDVLVLDGRKISGSLLKGAEGLELEKGEHQVLFRVEKTLMRGKQSVKYVSVPLIVSFSSQTKSISIQLPPMTTLREGHHFDRTPQFQLLDEHGNEITSRRDTLHHAPGSDIEQAMVAYNRNGRAASVPRFAKPESPGQIQQKQGVKLVSRRNDDNPSLSRWIYQVDNATREQLARLKRVLRNS